MEKVGADRVVLPEWESGTKLATNLISENIIEFIELSEHYSIAEIEPKAEWHDLSLQKSNVRANTGLNIVAIKRDKKVIVSPKPDEIINQNDILVVIGETKDVQRLSVTNKKSGGFFDREF